MVDRCVSWFEKALVKDVGGDARFAGPCGARPVEGLFFEGDPRWAGGQTREF